MPYANNIKRVYIVGATGFIGSHLCIRFIQEGYHVIGVDQLGVQNASNISPLLPVPSFEWSQHDLTLSHQVAGTLDYVIHAAFPLMPFEYAGNPAQRLEFESLITQQLIQLAREKNARFVQVMPSSIFGDPLASQSAADSQSSLGPRTVFEASRRFQESMVLTARSRYQLDAGVARIHRPFGPGMPVDDRELIGTLIQQALRGEHLTLAGNGSLVRSYCYIDDLIEGIFRLTLSRHQHPVDLGSPDEITILELAYEILKLNKFSQRIVFTALPGGDLTMPRVDIRKAKEVLNWSPKISTTEGLQATFRYFKTILTPRPLQRAAVQIV